jgi:integrase/recombinase XerC
MSIKPFLDYLAIGEEVLSHTIKHIRANLNSFKLFIKNLQTKIGIEQVSYSEIRSWIVSLIKREIVPELSIVNCLYYVLIINF